MLNFRFFFSSTQLLYLNTPKVILAFLMYPTSINIVKKITRSQYDTRQKKSGAQLHERKSMRIETQNIDNVACREFLIDCGECNMRRYIGANSGQAKQTELATRWRCLFSGNIFLIFSFCFVFIFFFFNYFLILSFYLVLFFDFISRREILPRPRSCCLSLENPAYTDTRIWNTF